MLIYIKVLISGLNLYMCIEIVYIVDQNIVHNCLISCGIYAHLGKIYFLEQVNIFIYKMFNVFYKLL